MTREQLIRLIDRMLAHVPVGDVHYMLDVAMRGYSSTVPPSAAERFTTGVAEQLVDAALAPKGAPPFPPRS